MKEPEPAPRRTRAHDTRQQHNIVTNLDHSVHHWAPPDERCVCVCVCVFVRACVRCVLCCAVLCCAVV
ncbi:MAG: hypothetical protein P4L40_07485, partial [Terracidiphilus sp.]|nr:hypothetical protein [Terracidiphilus sp.]